MSIQRITLEAWAARVYGEQAPNIQTLRRWARDELIVPAPQKHGRTYFVEPTAQYVPRTSTLLRKVIENGASA